MSGFVNIQNGGFAANGVALGSAAAAALREDTRQEAISNIKEAIELYIEVLKAEGQIVPEEKYEAFLVAV